MTDAQNETQRDAAVGPLRFGPPLLCCEQGTGPAGARDG
jgi:hypothetical protein